MGNREVKLKIELGDYKFECRGAEDKMITLAISNLNNYTKAVNSSSY